jgi:DNA-binding NtrC family response regulator
MARKELEGNSRKVAASEQGLKLLLVDEDASDLDYYSEVLRYLGYNVRPIGSYTKAAAMLGREKYDLVIVDQGSSNFEGRSVLSRAIEVDRRVPVLVLTRTVDADCCIEALNSGAYEYVQKPLTTTEVRELVSDYVKTPPIQFSSRAGYAVRQEYVAAEDVRVGRESLRKAS